MNRSAGGKDGVVCVEGTRKAMYILLITICLHSDNVWRHNL